MSPTSFESRDAAPVKAPPPVLSAALTATRSGRATAGNVKSRSRTPVARFRIPWNITFDEASDPEQQ